MDFINHNIKRLNLQPHEKLGFISQVPNIRPTEMEQLNNDIIQSIKKRTEKIMDGQNNQGSFEKMVQRMHGQDISNVSDLTKDFEKKTKINY
jgi:hypothetical protein